MCEYWCVWEPKWEGVISPAAGLTDNYESSHLGTGNQTLVLCKSSKCSYLLSHVSRPSIKMLINVHKYLYSSFLDLHSLKPTTYGDEEGFLFYKVEDIQGAL